MVRSGQGPRRLGLLLNRCPPVNRVRDVSVASSRVGLQNPRSAEHQGVGSGSSRSVNAPIYGGGESARRSHRASHVSKGPTVAPPRTGRPPTSAKRGGWRPRGTTAAVGQRPRCEAWWRPRQGRIPPKGPPCGAFTDRRSIGAGLEPR